MKKLPSLGAQELFRVQTNAVFKATSALVCASILSFLAAFSVVGLVKEWQQLADDTVNGKSVKLESVKVVSEYFPYALPMSVATAVTVVALLLTAVAIAFKTLQVSRRASHDAVSPGMRCSANDGAPLESNELVVDSLRACATQAAFVADVVFTEVVSSTIASSTYTGLNLSGLSASSAIFSLAAYFVLLDLMIPLVLLQVPDGRAQLLKILQPAIVLAQHAFVFMSYLWLASLLTFGPNKFPPCSWMTYSLPAIGIITLTLQLRVVRKAAAVSHEFYASFLSPSAGTDTTDTSLADMSLADMSASTPVADVEAAKAVL